MFITKPPCAQYQLIDCKNGERKVVAIFDSLKAAVECLTNTFGQYFLAFPRAGCVFGDSASIASQSRMAHLYSFNSQHPDYVLFDLINDRLTSVNEVRLCYQDNIALKKHNKVARTPVKGAPVPGTGKRTCGYYYRRPKTKALRTKVASITCEEPDFRAKLKRYPDSHDDICIGARFDRNWKRYRKQQYKL